MAAGLEVGEEMDITTERFLEEVRNNNYVFSAFKTHRMQNDVAAQLIDPVTGQLKSFDKWMRDIKGITDHYCKSWLETEYNTAVIRAHQAADWKHFVDEQDVFPNLRWMPTTSLTPDPVHENYWSKKLTLPINHPFWQDNRPGDRWNCKCSLQQTDEPVNADALDGYTPPLPMPGLDNNPADDGKLFSDTHPYYTEAYPEAPEAAKKAVFEAKTVEEAKQFILEYIADELDFDIKKSQLEILNPILNQMRDRMELFGIPKFKSFSTPKRKGVAAYDSLERSFRISPRLLTSQFSVTEYENQQKFYKRYGIYHSASHYPGDVVRNIIDHEFGHAIFAKNIGIQRDVIYTDSKDLKKSLSLGHYADTNTDEYFAECIAAYMGPGREDMNEIELKLIERVFKECKFRYY